GRGNFSAVRSSGDLRQGIDYIRVYRGDRPRFGGKIKISPDLREHGSEHAEAEDAVDRVDAGQDPLADQVAQGLGGAAAEGAVAGAAVEARHRELVGEAIAAMHLDRLAGDPERHLVA